MEVQTIEEPLVDSNHRPLVEESPEEPRRIRRTVLLTLAAIGVLAGLTWGFQRWSYARSHVSTDDAQVDGHVVPVLAKVGGYIKDVAVDENDRVTKGQSLVVLDDTEIKDRLSGAEADLAAAEVVAYGGSQSQVTAAERQSAGLEAQIAAARANAEKAENDLVRIQALADPGIVSKQELDAAEAAATAAKASVRALEQQAAAAQAGVTGAESSVRLAQAKLKAAEAARDDAAQQLVYTHIAAPTAGVVAQRQAEVGQLVQPGQPLMAIVADSSAWVTANFKETDLGRLRVGQPVAIELDAYPDCEAHGVVESLSAATGSRFALIPPDNATGNFTKVVQRIPARIRIVEGCGPDEPLRPGLSAVVHVDTAE